MNPHPKPGGWYFQIRGQTFHLGAVPAGDLYQLRRGGPDGDVIHEFGLAWDPVLVLAAAREWIEKQRAEGTDDRDSAQTK